MTLVLLSTEPELCQVATRCGLVMLLRRLSRVGLKNVSVAALNSYICCHLWACKRDMTDLRLIIYRGVDLPEVRRSCIQVGSYWFGLMMRWH